MWHRIWQIICCQITNTAPLLTWPDLQASSAGTNAAQRAPPAITTTAFASAAPAGVSVASQSGTTCMLYMSGKYYPDVKHRSRLLPRAPITQAWSILPTPRPPLLIRSAARAVRKATPNSTASLPAAPEVSGCPTTHCQLAVELAWTCPHGLLNIRPSVIQAKPKWRTKTNLFSSVFHP